MRPLHYLSDPNARAAERRIFIEAALGLLAHTDSNDLTVTEVVNAAGRNNSIFYKLFGSREGLVIAVVEHTTQRMVDAMHRQVSKSPTPREAITVWCNTLLGLARPTHAAGSVLPMALDRHRILRKSPESEQAVVTPLKTALSDMLGDHSLSPLRVDSVFELVMGLQATWLALAHRPTDGQIQEVVDLVVVLAGLET